MKKLFCTIIVVFSVMVSGTSSPTFAQEAVYPDYVQNAQALVEKASAQARALNSFTDEILIAQNMIRNAETEYKKNLSWTGNLDPKAEPTVKYYSSMAKLQALIVLSYAGKIAQEKERARLEDILADVKAKIKVFNDKNAEIASLKKSISDLSARMASESKEREEVSTRISRLGTDLSAKGSSLASAEEKAVALAMELNARNKALSASEQKNAELSNDLSLAQDENRRLQGLIAAKGTVESQSQAQISALKRQKDFVAEVGKLGGVIKADADKMMVIFVRSALIKTSTKSNTLKAEGKKVCGRIVELLKNFPEYRAAIKVHGFGQPTRSEDAVATDQMARLLLEELVERGKLDSASITSLGVGQANPIYPKTNPEGNRRVEITFIKKQGK